MNGSTASVLLSHNRIPLAEASVKIYHAKFGVDPPEWQYFHQRGKVIFGRDEEYPRETDSDGSGSSAHLSDVHTGIMDVECYWFRLLDPISGKINWLFPVPDNLTYTMDKPFFHIFNGRFPPFFFKSRLWGFLFEIDAESHAFSEVVKRHLPTPSGTQLRLYSVGPSAHQGVLARSQTAPVRVWTTFPRMRSLRSRDKPASISERTPRITSTMISLPRSSSFAHLGHIGLNRDGEVERSESVDPSWARMINESQVDDGGRYTVTKDTVGCFRGFL
ncbi:hypothetical protein E1B28_006352 [Marasmius oreades]|uniref:CRIB domain-containing protein n=1 Tax=Marasmius oreades TaxID=181124 RepID=A0A9P7UVH7_9AGAR|nr:uncharacterized protein E1B28_006352 [Marasmius oreades]KAG7095628.1 hypothetical protein E1B28_006352 [Marasmius oreades]